MVAMEFLVLLVASITLNTVSFVEGEALGPRNITRIFGQTDVVIPCPYSSPIWKINSISYSSFGLPAVYLSSPVGIVIPIVLIEMNNTAFQCFYMDDTVAEESSVGILTVEIGALGVIGIGNGSDILVDELYMDHQNMFVGQSMTTLAWKPSLSGGTCDYYLIRSMDGCSDMSPLNMTWRNNRTYTRSFSTDYLANIQGLNRNFNITGSLNGRVCQKLPSSSTTFQINKETAETVSLSSSLRRSNKLYLTSGDFLLVHIPSMTEYKDCSCVINLDKDLQEDNCYDLPPTCSCLNQTIFNSSLQVCKHDSLSNAVIVQLHNLVDIMNGTTLFFSNSKFCTNMPSSRLPFIIYLYSLRISIVLPEPAVITKLQDQEVCYKSTSGLTQSELIVYDVTGEQTFHTAIMETRPNDTICRDVGFSLSVPIQLCAPYKISIKVYNNIGFSYTNKTILSSMSRLESEDELSRNETEDNQCACLKRSVHADISVHSGSASIEVEVTCTIGYISDIILINSINLNEELSRNISCSTERKSESTTFHDLDCEREYNISLTSYYWSYCIVSSTEQPVTASPLCRSPKNLTAILASTLTLGPTLIIIVAAAAVGLTSRYCYNKRHSTDLTTLQPSEDDHGTSYTAAE